MTNSKSVIVIGKNGEDSPHIKILRDILKEARQVGASSISILPGNNSYSITCFDGVKVTSFKIMQWKDSPCITEWSRCLVTRVKILAGMKISVKNEAQIGQGEIKGLVFKAVTLPTTNGEAVLLSFA